MNPIQVSPTCINNLKLHITNIFQASMQNCKDISIRQRIVVSPFDHAACKNEMNAIEQAAHDAVQIDVENPYLPAPVIIRPHDQNALHCLGLTMVGNERKLLIQ